MSRVFHSPAHLAKELNLPVSKQQQESSPETSAVECPTPTRIGYMFQALHHSGDEQDFLDPSPETVQWLKDLGKTMDYQESMSEESTPESNIPSAYTYFGQLVVHNLSLIPNRDQTKLGENPDPLPFEVVNSLLNPRSGLLDLNNLYGPIQALTGCYELPLAPDGKAMPLDIAVGTNEQGTDLKRSLTPPYSAQISDRRDDENLIISQLHLAFLRAHNKLISAGASYEGAHELLCERYQYLVINDLLPRLVSSTDIEEAKTKSNLYLKPQDEFFLPVEFAAAAFRFGHAMIRPKYNYNQERKKAQLFQLFMPSALGSYHHILADWIIDWTQFLPNGENRALKLLPMMVEPLSHLTNQSELFSLAVRDLLRGYQLRLPTGQAVARALGLEDRKLEGPEILQWAANDGQREVLEASGFSRKTPLWFYLFVEASRYSEGEQLGPVCGQLLALVLLELARRSKASRNNEEWDPILGPQEGFDLAQFLRHALA